MCCREQVEGDDAGPWLEHSELLQNNKVRLVSDRMTCPNCCVTVLALYVTYNISTYDPTFQDPGFPKPDIRPKDVDERKLCL